MAAEVEIAHESAGRLRFRVAERRGDAAFFERIAAMLARCPGVQTLRVNPLTGSVLIHHESQTDAIVEFARTHELFETKPVRSRRTSPSHRAANTARRVDASLQERTGGTWDLRELAFVVLAASGLVQIARHNIWPAGVSLLWYAATLMDRSRPTSN
jgi:hypothetical protein